LEANPENTMKSALLASLLFYSGVVLANQAQATVAVPAGAFCSLLMTEAECAQHREKMNSLHDPADRAAYLERHLAILLEREVMCGRTAGYPALARMRAQYR
jgi:hypothetical protein